MGRLETVHQRRGRRKWSSAISALVQIVARQRWRRVARRRLSAQRAGARPSLSREPRPRDPVSRAHRRAIDAVRPPCDADVDAVRQPTTGLQFTREEIGARRRSRGRGAGRVLSTASSRPATFAADGLRLQTRRRRRRRALPLSDGDTVGPCHHGHRALDWNTTSRSISSPRAQMASASSSRATAGLHRRYAAAQRRTRPVSPLTPRARGPADIEMDGDLDIVVGVRNASPVVLRNNGDGTWARVAAVCRRHGRTRVRVG